MPSQQTHAQIIDQIAVINRNVHGIHISYNSTNLPQSLTQFPATMVLLGAESYTKFGFTEYMIRCYVSDVRTGNPSIAYQQCLELSTSFRDVYKDTTHIGDRMIDPQSLTTRAGFGNLGFAYTLKWGTGEYYGFTINLPLMSSIPGN